MMHDRLVCGMNDEIQKRLLAGDDLPLRKCWTFPLALEAVTKNTKQLQAAASTIPSNAVPAHKLWEGKMSTNSIIKVLLLWEVQS